MRRAFGYLRDRPPHPPPPNFIRTFSPAINRSFSSDQTEDFNLWTQDSQYDPQLVVITGSDTQEFRSCSSLWHFLHFIHLKHFLVKYKVLHVLEV